MTADDDRRLVLYVSPDGDDTWTGDRSEPTDDGTDGPLRTLRGAQTEIRRRRESAGRGADAPVTVRLRGGRHELKSPVEFRPDDGPVTFAAYADERPVLSGGVEIDGWETVDVDGTTAWKTTIPAVRDGDWYFRSLFVNGERATRTRLPKGDLADVPGSEFFWMEDAANADLDEDMVEQLFSGAETFTVGPEDIDPEWRNLTDVEAVALHYWVGERLPIETFDPDTGRVTSSHRSVFALIDDRVPRYARYYLENIFEALTEPGEWYLDRETGECYYVPREGEDLDEMTAVAPRVTQLVRVRGDPESDNPVEGVRFRDLTFSHADWQYPEEDATEEWEWAEHGVEYATTPQAEAHVPGALSFEGARSCAVEDCTIEHVGWYGMELDDGCRYNRVVGNEIRDLGAGGVKLDGAGVDGSESRRTGHNRVTDNHIHAGGRIFHSAVGILAQLSFDNDLSYNHIHDLYYSGISCGWEWTYDDQVTRDNRIEGNHIHDLGQGLLSDMGGIYTLGVQPGTVLRGNHIHDVEKHNYGGWAIYLDEGSSHILVEDNVCYDTSEYLFNLHYGRENVVRNNVFAFGADGVASMGRDPPIAGVEWKRHLDAQVAHDEWADGGDAVPSVLLSTGMDSESLTIQRNVLVTDGEPVFRAPTGRFGGDLRDGAFDSDLNLLWDVSDTGLVAGAHGEADDGAFDIDAWRELGHDRHSIVADPELDDDFLPAADGAVADVGFEQTGIDAGPRPPSDRT